MVICSSLYWIVMVKMLKSVRRISGHGLTNGILSNEREIIMLCVHWTVFAATAAAAAAIASAVIITTTTTLVHTLYYKYYSVREKKTNLRSNLNEKGRHKCVHRLMISVSITIDFVVHVCALDSVQDIFSLAVQWPHTCLISWTVRCVCALMYKFSLE